MFHMLLMTVAVVWGVSAVVVVAIFAVDERAFRRRSAQPSLPAAPALPVETDVRTAAPAPARRLATSSAG